MLDFIKNLFGGRNAVNFKQLVENGALIVDVRTPGEFKTGHVEGAVNIPFGAVRANLQRLQSHKGPIVAYCRSGQRSSMAVAEMKSLGLEAYNGGGLGDVRNALA
jgi:phage shock protein E